MVGGDSLWLIEFVNGQYSLRFPLSLERLGLRRERSFPSWFSFEGWMLFVILSILLDELGGKVLI